MDSLSLLLGLIILEAMVLMIASLSFGLLAITTVFQVAAVGQITQC